MADLYSKPLPHFHMSKAIVNTSRLSRGFLPYLHHSEVGYKGIYGDTLFRLHKNLL